MNQIWENNKKPNSGTDFGQFGPNLGSQFFFLFYLYKQFDIVPSYHPMEYPGKLMNQFWENRKKHSCEPDCGPFWPQRSFSWILALLDVKNCYKLSLYTLSRKTNELNLRKCKKPIFWPDFGLFWHNFCPQKFFSWVLPLTDVLNCGKLSLYATSRKTNEPNLRKWQKI